LAEERNKNRLLRETLDTRERTIIELQTKINELMKVSRICCISIVLLFAVLLVGLFFFTGTTTNTTTTNNNLVCHLVISS